MTEMDEKSLCGKRILLAEDNDISAALISEMFRQYGVLIDRAENGLSALETMRKSAYGEYKTILMDINMPKMNGLESAGAIRRLGRPDAAHIPIIGITADYPYQNSKDEAAAHGITDFIPKPINSAGFFKIRNYLLAYSQNI